MPDLEPDRIAEVDEVLEHLKVLRLEPDDVLVFTHPTPMSAACADHIKKRLSEVFPGHRAVVLDQGSGLGVIRRGDRS